MLKAILYYILLIAEFLITLIIGGTILGLYLAIGDSKGYPTENNALNEEAFPIIIGFSLLSMFIVWFTFGHYKFSKFSLGKVMPAAKWKAILYTNMPSLGITLIYYAASNLYHVDFLPKEMRDMDYLNFLPFAVVGSFFSAYVFYGAIQEELIRCGKKKWVQLLTLCLMMLPASVISDTDSGDLNVELTFLGLVSTCYAFWIYGKTRSTIILFIVYFVSNLVPFHIESKVVCIILIVLGIALTAYGWVSLRKKLPDFLAKDDD